MVPATPMLIGIPCELRDQIYELVWSSPGYARLTSEEFLERESRAAYHGAVAFPYPPKKPTKEDEDEVAVPARAVALARRGPVNEGEDSTDEVDDPTRPVTLASCDPYNEGEDSTDEEELSDSDEDGEFYRLRSGSLLTIYS